MVFECDCNALVEIVMVVRFFCSRMEVCSLLAATTTVSWDTALPSAVFPTQPKFWNSWAVRSHKLPVEGEQLAQTNMGKKRDKKKYLNAEMEGKN